MPVVLVRGAQPAAVQVDTLMGSREIVVKALGPQFSSVVGVSGGTILGDGSVVIILDLPNMMRHVHSLEYKEHIAIEHEEEAHLQHLLEDSVTSVLVVDDEPMVANVFRTFLEASGNRVVTCLDGSSALEAFEDQKFDLALVDLGMPSMDGWEVSKRLNGLRPEFPIILATGWNVSVDDGLERGAQVKAVLRKPFGMQDLTSAMDQALS